MLRRLPATLLLLLAATARAGGPPKPPELVAIRFEGNHLISSGDLEHGLVNQPTSWLPFARARRFDSAAFQGDLDRIRTAYRARGYFDVRARLQLEPHGQGKVVATVIIDEGEPSRLRAIDLQGIDDLPAAARAALQQPLPLAVGQVFTQADYERTKGELAARLKELSYAEASVTGAAEVDRAAHQVDVRLTVDPGPRYVYGDITVSGEQRVPAGRIQAEVAAAVKKGAPYQRSDLDEAQARIFDLGVFSNAEVDPGQADVDAGVIPIEAKVAEAKFHTIRPGVGVGLDIEHQEAHVSLGYTDRDFLGGLRRLDFDNTVALEWLPSVFNQIESAQPAGSSTLKLTQPEILGHNVDLVGSLQAQRDVELGFAYWALRAKTSLPWKITRDLTLTPSYSFETLFFDSNGISGINLSPTALLSLSCQTCVLSYFEQIVSWDKRDNKVEPTKGFYAQLSIQEAGGPFGGNFANTRWLPEVRGYVPLGDRLVVALRLQLGALFTYGGTVSPVDQRFFLGGIDSVRGYGAERLSPMVRVNGCNPIVVGGKAAPSLCSGTSSGLGVLDIQVGGNGMIEGSLELRYKLSDALRLVGFVDAGEVTEQPFAFDFGVGTLAITPGVGLRIVTPIGAIRLDLAYRAVDPIRPIEKFIGYGAGTNAPVTPAANSAAVDTCPWPIVPQTGWSANGQAYQQPSACKSAFLNNFAFNLAIGEAF